MGGLSVDNSLMRSVQTSSVHKLYLREIYRQTNDYSAILDSPKIPLDKQSRVVLIYTSLRKRFTPPSEARNAEESEIQPDIKGLIFIASAPSQLNRDD